ncbi:hypothetical protein PYCCODRAFT_1473136 [Trametes coccinea BRFM310]|uniref:RRM domain-containing protein n=1 Tax=Trametes coccinea (strain BRFM310) TaxID=1353009 RepID=A0A1Y2J6W6_TRAC3|nr:hypothetical protein PYCCODRAFT_1473136 [Trametes coccinea BRFM310]
MARRLYLGRLPPDARPEDVSKFFDGYGRIIDCRVMTGFGFVEFESSRDAEDALNNFNGKSFMGNNIVVEFAKETRPRREPFDPDRAVRSRRPPGYRLIVSGISRDTSWQVHLRTRSPWLDNTYQILWEFKILTSALLYQDLKDFGREAGSVSYADIDRDYPGEGILEYLSREDAERAVKELDGRDLRGQPVRVTMDRERGGADDYRREPRRDDRRDDRYARDDRYRDDRNRDDRYRDDRTREDRSYRRDRSRSPPRRTEVDDRRPRSPPPRRDVEDRRPAGDDDRRRDDRRRDEKDDRYDDRPPRHANGDNGWAR